jgi:hypothetical protein
MAANAQQGISLVTLLVGFTTFFAGIAAKESYPVIGVLAAIIGAVLLIASAYGFYRIKSLG